MKRINENFLNYYFTTCLTLRINSYIHGIERIFQDQGKNVHPVVKILYILGLRVFNFVHQSTVNQNLRLASFKNR